MYSKWLHETTEKEMSKWQKEVFIMPADLQSESNLIHSHTAPCVGRLQQIAHGYRLREKYAVWGVFGAV